MLEVFNMREDFLVEEEDFGSEIMLFDELFWQFYPSKSHIIIVIFKPICLM